MDSDNKGSQTHILRPGIDEIGIYMGPRAHRVPQGIRIEKPCEDLLREIDNALAYDTFFIFPSLRTYIWLGIVY
jgi:hypothetical protein